MSKPAATLGSTLAHGGQITSGTPTVLIGGKLAARLGDQHLCPASDGPKPHVGGTISSGSSKVLISGLPAARAGDQAICVGPPNKIVMGEPSVLIGD